MASSRVADMDNLGSVAKAPHARSDSDFDGVDQRTRWMVCDTIQRSTRSWYAAGLWNFLHYVLTLPPAALAALTVAVVDGNPDLAKWAAGIAAIMSAIAAGLQPGARS